MRVKDTVPQLLSLIFAPLNARILLIKDEYRTE